MWSLDFEDWFRIYNMDPQWC